MELFWLAGLRRTSTNDWCVRTVFRGRSSGEFFQELLPIGLMPMLTVGACFEEGRLSWDKAAGQLGSAVVENVSDCDVITTDDLPTDLYTFPRKAGVQRLLRYRTVEGDLLIPAIELIRTLFIHNRTLALSLMRPAGLEQLFYPQAPGAQDTMHIRFTREMPSKIISKSLALEFAWIALDKEGRRSWDSVWRSTIDQPFVMFEPPTIHHSTWQFRGVRSGNTWLIFELLGLSGRRLPFDELLYSHPDFTKSVRIAEAGVLGKGDPKAQDGSLMHDIELNVVNEGAGSSSDRNSKRLALQPKRSPFDNTVTVLKVVTELAAASHFSSRSAGRPLVTTIKQKRTVHVTAGERASRAPLPPLDFETLPSSATAEMGDLEALDETARHLRDLLPNVDFQMTLTPLKPGRAISKAAGGPRSAMVVVMQAECRPPIALMDIERTGVDALSLMALHFRAGVSAKDVECAIKATLDGLVDRGGHWSGEVEAALKPHCVSERIPKMLIPRNRSSKFSVCWARRLVAKLGLMG